MTKKFYLNFVFLVLWPSPSSVGKGAQWLAKPSWCSIIKATCKGKEGKSDLLAKRLCFETKNNIKCGCWVEDAGISRVVSHHKAARRLAAWSLLWTESSLLVEPAIEMQMSRDGLAKGTGGKEPSQAL